MMLGVRGEPDLLLDGVWTDLSARPDLVTAIARAARQAIDDVLDAHHTGRFDIGGKDVSQQEKAFVGTRFEIRLIAALGLTRGSRFDCLISGVEVDIKFTLNRNWMIPVEAADQLCLLVRADDKQSTLSAYLGRMSAELLNPGANRDRKRSLSSRLMKQLRTIADGEQLPPNVLLHMEPADRTAVFAQRGQEDRFAEFFTRVNGKIIARDVILAIGQRADSLKRVRAIKKRLASAGYALLCGSYRAQREWAKALGGPVPGADEWVSLRCDGPDRQAVLASLISSMR